MASAQNAFDRGDLAGAITITRQISSAARRSGGDTAIGARLPQLPDYNRAIDRTTALDVTTEALRRQPMNLDVLAIHAFTLQAVGSSDAAADAALRSLEKNPNDSLARTALALAYGGAGALDAALRESQRAVQSATVDAALDALRALAITYSDTGSYDDAVRTVERAITLNRNLWSRCISSAPSMPCCSATPTPRPSPISRCSPTTTTMSRRACACASFPA
ncbi:MAG: hypothetical protein LC121_14035 [Anaerolineae bacterium]|nr:hypothetical protein [Anaerolineae bacterium]